MCSPTALAKLAHVTDQRRSGRSHSKASAAGAPALAEAAGSQKFRRRYASCYMRQGGYAPLRAQPPSAHPSTAFCMPYLNSLLILASGAFSLPSDLQSALHPKGEHAGHIAEISWLLFIGAAFIFVLVLALLVLALYGPARWRALLGRRALVVGGGLVFPIVVLSALLWYGLGKAAVLMRAETPAAVHIEVIGELWWWRVRYLDADGRPSFETANEIRIPAGVPVELWLKSDNVIHSFWAPNLAGKLDMIPGRVNRLRVRAAAPGIFRGQCAEYCGAQHAKMMLHVQALSPDDFDAWQALQRLPAREPADARLQAGKRRFMQACARCHAVRGSEARGSAGPDLTHAGSRPSLGANVLPNNVGTLAGWIAGNQHIKPGNLMPSFGELSSEDLRAISLYVASLE